MAGDDAVLPCDKAILTVRMNQREEFERMNKNGHSATMYETMPAVAGLNKVEGFEPFSLLERTVSPVTGEEKIQFGLAYKKLWFRLANPKGRIQVNRVSLTEQSAVFEAQVYLDCSDANPVSSFVSGYTRENAPGGRYVQAAQYEAMDGALTDAGFGLQFADVCTDCNMAGEEAMAPRSGTRYAAGEGRAAQSAGTVAAPAGNDGHTGTMVKPFPGIPAGIRAETVLAAQPVGARQPVQAAAMPQGHRMQPVGARQSMQATAVSQGQKTQPARTGQPMQATAASQGQKTQPAGTVQPFPAVAPQGQKVQPAGAGQPVLATAASQGQRVQPGGSGQPVQATAVSQGQKTQLAGTGQPFPAVVPQGQKVQPAGAGQPVQAIIPQEQATKPVGIRQPVQDAVLHEQGTQPAENGQERQRRQQNQLSVAVGTAGSMDSLPVPPVEKAGWTAGEADTAGADTLPVPANSTGKENSRSSVQEAMVLLKGQALSAGMAENTAGDRENRIERNIAGNTAAMPAGAAAPDSSLPVKGETVQGGPAPRYTADMSVEEIVSLMTLEEAGKVVVDTGASRGMTVAEVAERRPPTLKYYRYGGYRGSNNILRAAAQVMLDSIEEKKAG